MGVRGPGGLADKGLLHPARWLQQASHLAPPERKSAAQHQPSHPLGAGRGGESDLFPQLGEGNPPVGLEDAQDVAVYGRDLVLDHEMDVLLEPAIARDQRHEDQDNDDADQARELLHLEHHEYQVFGIDGAVATMETGDGPVPAAHERVIDELVGPSDVVLRADRRSGLPETLNRTIEAAMQADVVRHGGDFVQRFHQFI